jgi:hypothetical protein
MASDTKVPVRYVPKTLSTKDKIKQLLGLMKSRKAYKKGKYVTRKHVASFHSKPSGHVAKALKMYKVNSMKPSVALAKATKCNIKTLKKIVNKGEGAFYSSGSRPNQTAQSWGHARLASALTSGNAAIIDYRELEAGCDHRGPAFKGALRALKRGRPKPKHISV